MARVTCPPPSNSPPPPRLSPNYETKIHHELNVMLDNLTEQAISELAFTYVSKRVLVHNLSYGNQFDFQDNEGATWKWPTVCLFSNYH